MRLRSIVLALGLALLISAPLRAATVTVTIQNFSYSPDPVDIAAGDTVHWVWNEGFHSTTSDTLVWDSGNQSAPAATFDFTFPTAGSFPYHCTVHGAAIMSSIVRVASPVQLQSFNAE